MWCCLVVCVVYLVMYAVRYCICMLAVCGFDWLGLSVVFRFVRFLFYCLCWILLIVL